MPIFHKLRKGQIKTEGIKRYLLYAIGEIILVVIGILIALEINNWNERQKELQQEKVICKNLNHEFRKNHSLLVKQKEQYRQIRASINLLMSLMGKPESEIRKYNTDSLIATAIDVTDFRPTANVVAEIIGSGKMNLIYSDSLKNALFTWTATIEEKKEAWETQDQFLQNMLMPYLTKNASLKNIDAYGFLKWEEKSKLKNDNLKLFQEIEFENNLDNHAWSVFYFQQTLSMLEVTSYRIIRLTDSNRIKN